MKLPGGREKDYEVCSDRYRMDVCKRTRTTCVIGVHKDCHDNHFCIED